MPKDAQSFTGHLSGNLVRPVDWGSTNVPNEIRYETQFGTASKLWLQTAAALPGKSLHVAFALLSLAMQQSSIGVRFSNQAALQFHVNRASKYRALAWLENAGLITVVRKTGYAPLVKIKWRHESDETGLE